MPPCRFSAGIDASNWDWGRGPVDVARAVREGISFLTHKATEGTSYTDPFYGRAAARARGVVGLFGAYHVLHTGSVAGQVDHFLAVLDAQSPWWRAGPFLVQLDCERWANDFPGAADITAWCATFRARTGGRWAPVVYASRGQYDNNLSTVDCPLWNADYGHNNPGAYRAGYPGDNGTGWRPYSGKTPAIWQYTSTAVIAGQAQCDANAYRGALTDLIALTNGGMDMEQTEKVNGSRARGNTVGDVLADGGNWRDWWYLGPDAGGNNPPGPGSRADIVLSAARQVLAGKPAPVVLTDTDRQLIVSQLVTELGAQLDQVHTAVTNLSDKLTAAAHALGA